jgi:hypothetical protein
MWHVAIIAADQLRAERQVDGIRGDFSGGEATGKTSYSIVLHIYPNVIKVYFSLQGNYFVLNSIRRKCYVFRTIRFEVGRL